MSGRRWSRVENLLYALESQLRIKKQMLKTRKDGIEKIGVKRALSLTGAVTQLEADITAIRGWLKYRKEVPL